MDVTEQQVSDRLTIHLYAQCWNDAYMLPFFFRHYDSLVDRYVLYDDGSTDGTLDILKAHPSVEVRRFPRSDAQSFVLSEQALSNDCWKESRGAAHWVIVTDIDEHLHHPRWHDYLAEQHQMGTSLIPALGFQMISEARPAADARLFPDYPVGAPWTKMMKPSIFDPVAIAEINFQTGRHSAAPQGRVQLPGRDEMVLLHYKYLGFGETHRRHGELREGLGADDLAKGWGHKYAWSEAEFRADWEAVLARAADVRPVIADPERYPLRKWWAKYRG